MTEEVKRIIELVEEHREALAGRLGIYAKVPYGVSQLFLSILDNILAQIKKIGEENGREISSDTKIE